MSRLASISLGVLCGAFLAAGCSSSTDLHLRWGRVDDGIDPLDQELVVNGEVVPEAVIRRALVYARGNTQLEAKKLDVYLQQEIRRQIAEGADPAKYGVSAESVEAAREEALQSMREQYPDMDPQDVLIINDMDMALFTDSLEQTKLFDLVFLPENPNEWPDTTVALMEGSGGSALIGKLKESWEAREAAAEGPEPAPEDAQGMAMWKTILRQLVIQGLKKDAVVETAVDGLPPEICMVVNGQEVRTDEMYERIANLVSDEDVRRTRYWLAKTTALRQKLESEGQYMSDEEFEAAYDEHESPYKDSPFPIEVIALGFKKFPSLDAYKRYFRLMESYRRSIEDELTNETLAEHMERANQMLGLARVDSQVILCSAFDFKRNSWFEDGWERAARRATEATQKLAAGEDWDVVLEEYSDYWDPPAPTTQEPTQQQPQRKNKGRFGPLNRNELVQRVGESEYEMFLMGSSVTDHVFFDQEPGTVDGPLKGVHGWYITRVLSRSQPTQKTMSLEDEKQRDLVVQDYLACRFNAYAQDVLHEAAVQGVSVPF